MQYFDGAHFEQVELTQDNRGQYHMDGKPVDAYVSTYHSIGGPKAQLLTWNDELGFYEPWQTWYAAKDMEQAKMDALMWAQAEDIPADV